MTNGDDIVVEDACVDGGWVLLSKDDVLGVEEMILCNGS